MASKEATAVFEAMAEICHRCGHFWKYHFNNDDRYDHAFPLRSDWRCYQTFNCACEAVRPRCVARAASVTKEDAIAGTAVGRMETLFTDEETFSK